jgi:DNA invertase Pin-like site-specific DNA recombinase
MIYGYARVSTEEQNLDLQIDALTKYGCEKIITEKVTGKTTGNELRLLLKSIKTGDSIVVWKLDRLGRRASNLIQLIEDFDKQGITFISLKEEINTSSAMGKFIVNIFCCMAQMEREVLSERTKAGLIAAKERGKFGGRPKSSTDKVRMALKLYKSGAYTIKEIYEITSLSPFSIYNYLSMSIINYYKLGYSIENISKETGATKTYIIKALAVYKQKELDEKEKDTQ